MLFHCSEITCYFTADFVLFQYSWNKQIIKCLSFAYCFYSLALKNILLTRSLRSLVRNIFSELVNKNRMRTQTLNNIYLLTGKKVQLFVTEINSRYFNARGDSRGQ